MEGGVLDLDSLPPTIQRFLTHFFFLNIWQLQGL